MDKQRRGTRVVKRRRGDRQRGIRYTGTAWSDKIGVLRATVTRVTRKAA